MRSLKPLTFRIDPEGVLRSNCDGVIFWHLYLPVNEWPAGLISDAINPRSHGHSVLDSNVAADMRRTLENAPEDFVLANRGLLVLASDAAYDSESGRLCVRFDGQPAIMGLADGGTTDAVLADAGRVSRSARVHVEVVVGLNDPDRVASLVEGRNTSRQVQSSSLANAAGRLDWLKGCLPISVRDRISWEENSPGVPVSEVLGLLGMFRPSFGASTGFDWTHQQSHWAKHAQASYRDRSKLSAQLRDDAVLKDFERTRFVADTILMLYDKLYEAISLHVEAGCKKTKSASKEFLWNRTARPVKDHETPFLGRKVPRKVPSGWLFPLVASAHQFLGDEPGSFVHHNWKVPPAEFFPVVIDRGVRMVEEYAIGSKLTPDSFARSAGSFENAHTAVAVEGLHRKNRE